MALVIPTGFGQASQSFINTGDPDPWYITWGVDLREVGGDFQSTANDLAQVFAAFWAGRFSTQTRISELTLRVGQDGGPSLVYTANLDVPGTSTAAKLPQNCSLLIHKMTERAGRPGRGRLFVPNVLRESDVNDVGVLDSGLWSELTNTAQGWSLAMAGFGDEALDPPAQMVLLHNTGAPGGTVPDTVTKLTVDPRISTQRRRLRK